MGPLPNLVVIGAMKCATTMMYEILRTHPEIYIPEIKEPNYFSKIQSKFGGLINDNDEHWIEYRNLFCGADPGVKYIGEASTDYTKYPHCAGVPSLIKQHLGQPKLIYMVRDPVERTISHYKHSRIKFGKNYYNSIATAVVQDPILIDTSKYFMQLEQYWSVFGRENIYIIQFEKLISDFDDQIAKLAVFLDLPVVYWDPKLVMSNSSSQLANSRMYRGYLGPVFEVFGFMPKPVKDFFRGLLPKHDDIAITAEERNFVKKLLAPETEKFNYAIGEELYIP